jgi:glycosyltransferase involved in cell wall biosynthesis
MLPNSESTEEPLIHVLEIAGNAIVGGMEKYVYNLAQKLPAHSFKVTCMAPYESGFTSSLRHQGCEVYITAIDDSPTWRSIQFTAELIRQLQVDLVHAHLPKAHILAGLAGRLTNRPVVATIHGMDITSLELGITRSVGSHLTVVCQDAYSQALALGVPAERLTLIPNGVDTKTYSSNRSGATFRKSLRLPPDAPLVGMVGRLAWEKGPDQFLRAAERVLKQRPEVHFAFVGEGPMEMDLKEQIASTGLSERVHMPGVWTNTWEVYPAFDILAQTSRVEGMPFAILEAMACGCPVVAMAVGGVAELIEVGTTGLISAAGDWSGLGDAIVKLLDNPERMKQMGQAGRKRVEDGYDIKDSTRRMASLFSRLVKRKAFDESGFLPAWKAAEMEREQAMLGPVAIFPKRR